MKKWILKFDFSFQELDESNDRLEESCSCDLNSIDNTESDGSPSMVKSRSETLETPQSSEVISLDSRLSDKPDTPTTALENHTETPTILEETNSEGISLPTTQETSEVVSIESSSELYSEVQKIGSSSPDSVVHETSKKDGQTEELAVAEHVNNVVVTVVEPLPQAVTSTDDSSVEKIDEETESKTEEAKNETLVTENLTIEAENTETSVDVNREERLKNTNAILKANGPMEEVKEDERESDPPVVKEIEDTKSTEKVEEAKKETATKIGSEDVEEEALKVSGEKEEECAKESVEVDGSIESKSEELSETEKLPMTNVVIEEIARPTEAVSAEETIEEKTQQESSQILDEIQPMDEKLTVEKVDAATVESKPEANTEEKKVKLDETSATQVTEVEAAVVEEKEEEVVAKEEKEDEKLKVEKECEDDSFETHPTTTEIQESSTESKNTVTTETIEQHAVKVEENSSAKEEDTENSEDKIVGAKTDENDVEVVAETDDDKNDENVKSLNCSTSVVESSEACSVAKNEKDDGGVDDLVADKVETENKKDDDKAELLENSRLSNGVCAVDSLTEDKSAVINDNGEKMINEKHSREPSNICTSDISDNNETNDEVQVRTDEVDVITDSVCNSRNVQSSVDNTTQVPNPKQQIPTISTVCDATKSLPDGVPQIVSANVIARDNPLSNDITTDHVDAHRRSSLPNVTSDNVADNSGDEPPSLPVPLRKTSSPQKRPRSASTSTQVDPNHFGKFSLIILAYDMSAFVHLHS